MAENFENKATRGSISQIILTALSTGSKYGYEICKDIERLTNGRLILKQPSLYSSLRRMEDQNLISSYWEDSSLGGKRHYYTLTEKGKELYEKNKTKWEDKEDLLENLPENPELNKVFDEKEEVMDSPTPSTYVLNQENLFSFTRNNEKIKKLNENEDDHSDENKSFLQFDFFEQNIKFVKESSLNKQEVSAFTNKFSDMDNHAEEIEPHSEDKIKNDEDPDISSTYILKEFEGEDLIKENEKDESLYAPPLHFEEIKRKDQEKTLSEDENKETYINIFDVMTDNPSDKDSYVDNNMNDSVNNMSGSISWENNNSSDAENPIFDTKDYKGIIGKLYNNSQLKDPYEQNKYHTFKEIFPSSQLKQKEKKEEIYKESAVDAIIESNTNSNIDCDDIKMLNSLYNLQGINIKIHKDIENKKQNKVYTDKNKLNMVCAWLISILMLFEVIGTYFILKNQDMLAKGQTIIYFLGVAVTLSYCIIQTLENAFDRFKLVVITKKFSKKITTRLLIFILAIIFTFAINLAFGMSNLMQIEFLSYWLIPSLLSTNFIVHAIIYQLLYNSKKFNS